ncbi:hypothetical protein [Streptomyces cirratus]|uniref:hypothetical protein n=1 Tax=Streptomyces cirratus TaxID=68187 RepID=UPI003570EC67
MRASDAEFDAYAYPWIETIQNHWFGRPENWDTLPRAMDLTAPANVRIARQRLDAQNSLSAGRPLHNPRNEGAR